MNYSIVYLGADSCMFHINTLEVRTKHVENIMRSEDTEATQLYQL